MGLERTRGFATIRCTMKKPNCSSKVVCAFAGMCALTITTIEAVGGEELPAGYRRVEYIQGDGLTSDVVTDFTPNPQTDKVVFELEMTDLSHNMYAFSARKNAADASWSASWSVNLMSAGGYRFEYNDEECFASGQEKVGDKFTYVVDGNVATRSDGATATATPVATFTQAGSVLHLFNRQGSTSSVGNFKLYSFKIYRNNNLIHDLVPAEDPQGQAVFVDVVGKMSITMKGTFYKPLHKAKRLEWVQCDGGKNAYFETDFVPDSTRDKMEVVVTPTKVDRNQFVFGARSGNASKDQPAWALQLHGSTGFRYDFNKISGTTQSGELVKDVKYTFTADANKLTWSHGEGITSTENLFSAASGPLKILYATAATTYTACKLHSFRIWRDGKLIHEFLPTRLPSGETSLMDYGSDPIPVTRVGLFQPGPEVPSGLLLLVR